MSLSKSNLIFLIGFMGSGKTTLGKALARTLQFDYVDLDAYIEQQIDKTIAEYFSAYGEPAFRLVERDALRQLGARQNTVISTGGGTPCHANNMQWMLTHGITVYLQMPPKALLTRLSQKEQSKRPLLQNKTPAEIYSFIEDTLAERAPYYEQATYIVDGLHIMASDLAEQLKG